MAIFECALLFGSVLCCRNLFGVSFALALIAALLIGG